MDSSRSDFPPSFVFGAATSSYQIEGTSFGTCGPSHWDTFAAAGGTAGREDGSVACAHFLHFADDLDLVARAGFDAYRFSVAWPRIQPEGKGPGLAEGLDFYDRLVDACAARGIAPYLTLYHWDLPAALAEAGGWRNRDTAMRFADYADIVCRRIGDRVRRVATINEPWCVAWLSHFLGLHAPGLRDLGAAAKAMHTILVAHGAAVEALRASGQGDLGIVLNMTHVEADGDRDEDERARAVTDAIWNRWFVEAIAKGRYPGEALEHLEPLMPEAWRNDMEMIAQPIDWMGLNYYTRTLVSGDGTDRFPFATHRAGGREKNSLGWEFYPEGLERFLLRLKDEWTGELPIVVAENGMSWHDEIKNGAVDDAERCRYYDMHLEAVRRAVAAGAPVEAFFAWSLLDNFEWAEGYRERFGLVHVDFASQVRTPKRSYHEWTEFLSR